MASLHSDDAESIPTTALMQSSISDLYTYSISEDGHEADKSHFETNKTIRSPSMEAASSLLQKLISQLTLNDSPPSNESEHDVERSRQPPPSTHSSSRTSVDKALEQQGTIRLVNLCRFTLQSLGGEASESCQQSSSSKVSIETKKTIPDLRKTSPSLRWMKKLKHDSKSEYDESRDASEDIREKNQRSTRLQLFGSEYARFLSTTPLAPNPTKGHASKVAVPRRNVNKNTVNIEDADTQVQTGPITDIIVTRGSEKPPKGYYRVSKTPSGEPFYIGDVKFPFFLCVKKERNWDRAAQRPCVTAMTIIFPERKEFVPPGFILVRSPKTEDRQPSSSPINLNVGGNEAAYLCFRRSREGNPLTAILPLFPSNGEHIPEGYTVLERTPRNYIATLHTSNAPVFLAFRQRLANLESLRPLPLVLSVLNGDSNVTRLEAYYCTGGTIVRSQVGRFHIMDRSTHSLLSPSSINYRLALIEASRQKSLESISERPKNVGGKYSYSDTSSVMSSLSNRDLSSLHMLPSGLNASFLSDSERQSSSGDSESMASSFDVDKSFISEFRSHESPNASDQKNLDRCMRALSFIPSIAPSAKETDPKDMDAFKSRVSVLVPILTSCYTRHGGSAYLCISGLSDLLRQGFFVDDIDMSQDPSSRTTLLDLSIQVACDVATMGAQEAQLHICVEFVEEAFKYSCGYLSSRTVGYVNRFLLFVFYFGISSPSGNWGIVNSSDQYILEDTRFKAEKHRLPGGAPQSAILSLKDLIVFMIARLGSQVHFDQCSRRHEAKAENETSPCQHFNLVSNVIDGVVHSSVFRVELANFTEMAMHQILRSGGSELFWYEMINLCGSGLFGNDTTLREETRHMYSICFALLANCVKIASSKVRKNEKSEGIPRDVANKLMSLEMLKFFLEKWERGLDSQVMEGSHSLSSFAFCIRRLVVPCLLSNTSDALSDPRIFRRLIQVIGVLWCSPFYRRHMKLEIGILFDHFILGLLKLGPQILFRSNDSNDTTYVFAQQLELMKEINIWFAGDPDRILELYLNFDTEYGGEQVAGTKNLMPDLDWKVSGQLCALLCNIAEECTEYLGDKIKQSLSSSPIMNSKEESNSQGYEGMSIATLARESARRLRQGALDAVSQIIKVLALVSAAALGEEAASVTQAWYDGQKYTRKTVVKNSKRNILPRPDSALVVDYWKKLGVTNAMKSESIYLGFTDEDAEGTNFSGRKSMIGVAIELSKEKGLQKAIEYLIACNILTPSPREISSFLRIHCKELDPVILGRYLGAGGSEHEIDFWNQIRYSYIRAVSFVGMTVEDGLRHLLTEGGFRLPGESQQIDRVMSTFSRCYWEDNAGDRRCCPINDEDTILLLSFAIIMLNTDLHKVGHSSKKIRKRSQVRAMSKDEFIMNLKRANKGKEIDKLYLSEIYDGIQENPIALYTDSEIPETRNKNRLSENIKVCIVQMIGSVKKLDALLRGLAVHEHRYFSLDVYRDEIGESLEVSKLKLARYFMKSSWHRLHGLINSALKIAHLDPKALESFADLLKFSLCLTIILDMPTEQIAFLDQLGRFRLFNQCRNANNEDLNFDGGFNIDQDGYKNEHWYHQMRQQIHVSKTISSESQAEDNMRSTGSYEYKVESLVILNKVVDDMGIETTEVDADAAGRKTMRGVVKNLENAEFLLNDPTRRFLRQGNIVKRANRSGKDVEYRFFLFSDVLIYAKKMKASSSSLTRYKIHEELPLILMKVVDWFPPEMKKHESKRAIQFYHPRKNFLALCNSNEDRNSWVKDIREAIETELERKVAIEMARKAATNIPANRNRMATDRVVRTESSAKAFPVASKQSCMAL